MSTKARPLIKNSLVVLLLRVCCGSAIADAGDRVKRPQATRKDAVNRSIQRIITETLIEGEGVVNGIQSVEEGTAGKEKR